MKKLEQLISPNNLVGLFDNIHAMIALVQSDGVLISWNHAFEEIKNSSASINKLENIFSEKDRSLVISKLAFASHDNWIADVVLNEASLVVCDCTLIPMANGNSLFIAETVDSDPAVQQTIERLNRQVKMFKIESESAKKIARNKQIEMESVMIQAREVAQIDALTFLFNRRMIVRELQDEVLRAERYNNTLSISIIDVDKFKLVNDTYGHPAGDEVLKQVACQLRDHIRHPDTVGRYGGEEFLILLPNSDAKAATEQAVRLGKEIREMVVTIKEHELKVTVSIGIAQFKAGVDTWDTLLNRADNAMYEAKNNGRDCWFVAD
jgi:diguanylate cyclase (GGDEF)-like protein